jgi:hypothetical protein
LGVKRLGPIKIADGEEDVADALEFDHVCLLAVQD